MTRVDRGGLLILSLGIAISVGNSTVALGQGNVFNPYGNSGYADYREFATPMYSPDPSLPGQARIQGGLYGRSRANQFEAYTNSLDSGGSNLFNGRGGASGSTGRDDVRGYRPNDTPADRAFRERRAQREAAYSKAMEEKDPRKRAALMQQIDRDSLDRPLSAVTRRLAAQAKAEETANLEAKRTATNPAGRRGNPGAASPATRATRPAPIARGAQPASRAATPATPASRATAAITPAPEPAAIAPEPATPSTVPITPPR